MDINAVAIRYDKLQDACFGNLRGTRPVFIAVEQGLEAARLKSQSNLALASKPFKLDRVIVIIDQSGSMNDRALSNDSQSKFDYIKARFSNLTNDYFAADTAISLITFSDYIEKHLNETNFNQLRSELDSIYPEAGTDFSKPLQIAKKRLFEDRPILQRAGRSLIIFVTDGLDQFDSNDDQALRLATHLRKLNASAYILGIGSDYSMQRIMELSSAFGFSGWAHLPVSHGSVDCFDTLLPNFMQEIVAAEFYLTIKSSGSFLDFSSLTPSIKAAYHHKIFPGYSQEAGGLLFESQENLELELTAGIEVLDQNARKREIPIIDASDAGAYFEIVERGKHLIPNYLALKACLEKDEQALKELKKLFPDHNIDRLIQSLESLPDEDHNQPYSRGSQTFHGAVSDLGSCAYISKNVNPWSKVSPQVNPELTLHSGKLGPLDASNFDTSLPPANNPNAAAYNQVVPQNVPHLVLNGERFIDLSKLADNENLIVGRAPSCDIQINNIFVSRKNLSITRINDQFYVSDLGSHNGIYHNGTRLQPNKPQVLCRGDVITFCSYSLKFIS